jgi:hypothetical protein
MTITIIHRELIPSTRFGPIRLVFFWWGFGFSGFVQLEIDVLLGLLRATCFSLQRCGKRGEAGRGFTTFKDNASILKKFHCFIKN